MGLINLTTNLRSLKYGHDRLGGGSSGQPYIQTPIPVGESTLNKFDNDFLLRGGITAVTDSLTDVSRLTKFFTDLKTPSGLLFIAKQELLSRTAVRTQTSDFINEGIYLPTSTLAQVGVNAFGIHTNKQGIDPFEPTGARAVSKNLYFNRIKGYDEEILSSPDGILKNRLAALLAVKMVGGEIGGFAKVSSISSLSTELLSYDGGPGSNVGIGKTHIFLADQRTNTYKGEETNDTLVYTQAQIAGSSINDNGTSTTGNFRSNPSFVPLIQDFRKALRKKNEPSTVMSDSPSYDANANQTLENRFNLGDPGNRSGKHLASYVNGSGGNTINGQVIPVGAASDNSYDKINAYSIYSSDNVRMSDKAPIRDTVPFRIAAIDNDNATNKTFIHFRAFLNNITDNYSADWSDVKYLGRGEKFYNYNGFTRKVSLSWTVAAQSKAELMPMYKKLNYLASNLAPDYSAGGYMRGPLIQLTIGGYLYETPGFITDLTYELTEDSSWEIAIGDDNNQTDGTVKKVPHIIRVSSFGFVPIQDFIPAKQTNTYNKDGDISDYGPQRFISLANSDGDNYDSPDTNISTTGAEALGTTQNDLDIANFPPNIDLNRTAFQVFP